VPVEWFAVSSGARVALDSGTENMDWIAAALRRLVEFTQAGGEVNVVVTGINVGAPVCLIGLESQTLNRAGFLPADGPPSWTSGTLFLQSARKLARAINAASGNRPVVVLANLTGFDGSPESMRKWQLEYGAEIGRAVINFRGPIVFVVVSRYHGAAFVVFSKRLHDQMDTAVVTGSFASVIGGAPAAAVVLSRDVTARTEQDPRVLSQRELIGAATGKALADAHHDLAQITQAVRSEKLKEVADEFDSIHDIKRALRVGSVDHIIAPAELRPFIIGALDRRLAGDQAVS
jgi:acetyl-CoA carboxylase carboxyltransferase component